MTRPAFVGSVRRWTASVLDTVGVWCLETSSRLQPIEIPDAVLERVTHAIIAKLDAEPKAPEPQPFTEPFTVPAGTALCKWQGTH